MKKDFYKVVGVMSGTSLDGIDLVLCNFQVKSKGTWEFEMHCPQTIRYPDGWKSKLAEGIHGDDTSVHTLNQEYTVYLGNVIRKYLEENHITDIDAVCSHGHTLFHQPEMGMTLQIGNLPAIASIVGFPVVCDFRVQDVSLGGQGAPLVPIGDRLLFGDYAYCINLGGFANISFEGPTGRIAYDICPVNVVLNYVSNKVGKEYDAGGKMAASGVVNPSLLQALNQLEFYQKTPPKSLGMEWVNAEVLPLLESSKWDVHDLLRTFTEHIAHQLAAQISDIGKVLVTGGGAYNEFLIKRVRELSKADWILPHAELIEYKEALIFGLLGVLKLREEVNCLASVTGASIDHSSGHYFLP